MDLSWCYPSVLILVILDLLGTVSTQDILDPPGYGDTDSCDWTIWDDTRQQRGVRNIFARCTEGHIDWRLPYGAIRVLLQLAPSLHPRASSDSSTVEACFHAKSHFALAKISLETDTDKSSLSTSQVNLEPLVILNQTFPHMERELCFTSAASKPIVLFFEAQSDLQSTTSGHVEIDYDIQRIYKKSSKLKYEDPMEDCRPCTDVEILEAVCSSDFVVQGSIHTVLHSSQAQESQVRLNVEKIHRQRHLVFNLSGTASLSSRHSHNALVSQDRTYGGEVIVPYKCGIKKGAGDFLFMGRMRLKKALLKCAPRLEDFNSLWKDAIQKGLNPCTFD